MPPAGFEPTNPASERPQIRLLPTCSLFLTPDFCTYYHIFNCEYRTKELLVQVHTDMQRQTPAVIRNGQIRFISLLTHASDIGRSH